VKDELLGEDGAESGSREREENTKEKENVSERIEPTVAKAILLEKQRCIESESTIGVIS
jgi:hypothetical protein